MRAVAADIALALYRSRPICVCMLCKNGWADGDAIWRNSSCGPKEPCIRDSAIVETVADHYLKRISNHSIPALYKSTRDANKNQPLKKIRYLRNCCRFFHELYNFTEDDPSHIFIKFRCNVWFNLQM